MAFTDVNGLRTFYKLDGASDKPVLVLSHCLGLDHSMFDPQMPDLAASFRVLRYDTRGHGATDAPAGEYTIDQLGRDAVALFDNLGLDRVAWCGVSLGGMIGQWLGAHAPERLTALVLANTSPRTADPAGMEARRQTVLDKGMHAIVEIGMTRYFGPVLAAKNTPVVASAREVLLANNPVGYAGCCAVLRDADLNPLLGKIRVPTLVVAGNHDEPMPWQGHASVLTSEIQGATAVRLDTAHLSNLCLPRAFTRALLNFLSPRPADVALAGLAVRRAVLGDAHVDRSVNTATELTRDFQALIATFPWGTVWTRPGLDHRTRRLLVLAITASLGRWEEFQLHLSAGLDHGLEWSDVEETLLQTAAYAGIPAGNTAFKIASEERAKRTKP